MRRLIGFLLTVALLGLLALTAARFVVTDWQPAIVAASFSSFAVLGYAVALLGCLLLVRGARRRWLPLLGVLVALAALAAHVWWWAPMFTGDEVRGETELTVMSANLEFGRGDAVTVVRTVAEGGVDVLVLSEVSAAAQARLQQAGLRKLLPYVAGRAAADASGTMVWSRYALGDQQPLQIGNGGVDVRVEAPDPFRLLAVHNAMALLAAQAWSDDLRTLRARSAEALAEGPTMVVGDFNATSDHAQLRRVLDTGLRDAAEQADAGWQPTWPLRWRRDWTRPFLQIDRVLVGPPYAATRTRTREIPDTDHLALVADLTVRGSAGQ